MDDMAQVLLQAQVGRARRLATRLEELAADPPDVPFGEWTGPAADAHRLARMELGAALRRAAASADELSTALHRTLAAAGG